MRLRPYRSKSDYEYVEKWVNSERIHALWSANRLPCPLSEEALDAFLERDAEEWGGYACVATEEDGTPIGFFCYSVNLTDNAGFMKFILLDPELRGRGYGVKLVGKYEQAVYQALSLLGVNLFLGLCQRLLQRRFMGSGTRIWLIFYVWLREKIFSMDYETMENPEVSEKILFFGEDNGYVRRPQDAA